MYLYCRYSVFFVVLAFRRKWCFVFCIFQHLDPRRKFAPAGRDPDTQLVVYFEIVFYPPTHPHPQIPGVIKHLKRSLTELLKDEDAFPLGEALADVLQSDKELGKKCSN